MSDETKWECDHIWDLPNESGRISCRVCGRTFGETSRCQHTQTGLNRDGDETCWQCGEVNITLPEE